MSINSIMLLFVSIMLAGSSCKSRGRTDAATSITEPTATGTAADSIPNTMSPPAGSTGLRIMSYNVLKYGDGCQSAPEKLHAYLRTIIRYASPDVIGLVKVAADAPAGFADKVRDEAMNGAFANRYAVCPFTNRADGNNVNLLFYDRQKLGFAGMNTLLSSETDFNLYKLWLRSSVSAANHDTVFLYVLLNHTESGDNSGGRDAQMKGILQVLHKTFSKLPDVVDMGDFNLRNTEEPGYSALIHGDASVRFSDPPFALDHSLKYPADWESDPEPYARFLTTSTRKKEDEPNDCGTGGGAKFWFDHILLSSSIADSKGAFRYVPGSFRVIGNDGGRIGHAANAGKHPNTSVPPAVAEALFQFSNKYPVMLELKTRQ